MPIRLRAFSCSDLVDVELIEIVWRAVIGANALRDCGGEARDCGGGVSTEDDSDSDDNWWDSPGDGAEADGGLQGRGRQVPSPSTVMSGDRLPAARAGTATATGVDAAP